MLRVLQVASGDLWAGAEAQLAALVAELARREDISQAAVLLNEGELATRIRAAGVPVTVFDESRLGGLAILAGIRRVIRAFDPQLVHTHRSKENVLGSLAARLEGRRASLRTVHGAPEHAARWYRPEKRLFYTLDVYAEAHWQQCSVAVSDELGARLRAEGRRRVEVIHNGVVQVPGTGAEVRQRQVGQHAPVRVTFLGRLVPVKRVDLLLDVALALKAPGEGDFHVDIVGEGPLAAPLRERATQLGLDDVVTFHGFRSDVPAILSQTNVLVFTSDHEGTPMAALEALAMGVPVVGRAVGGLVEILDGTPGGYLVTGNDPKVLAAAIRRAAGAGGAAELPPRYQIGTCATRYADLYRSLAANCTKT